MAGIGFELKKIYGRNTLAANLWGTVYATMTSIGPAVLSALLMLILKILLDQAGLTRIEERFYVSASTYIFVIAMLIAVIFSAPVSRYISDCIYLKKESEICPSAFGMLTISTTIAGIVMLAFCIGMYVTNGIPMLFLVNYYFLGVLVTDAFTLMTYASALKHYRTLTFSFLLGVLVAVGVYFLCIGPFGVDKVTSACIALVWCYIIVVFALIYECVKTFGMPKGRYFAFLSYLPRYPKLTIAGIAYTLGLYTPTLIYWFFSQMSEKISVFSTTPSYDIALFLAILVNMPALVIFVVKVETEFYEKYTLYVSALNNGTHDLIQKERDVMSRTLRYQLFFVYEIQLIITIILACLACVIFPFLSASVQMVSMFAVLSLGVYASFCMYFTIVVFYYFSDYKGACISALVFLAVTTISAVVAVILNDFYPLPLLIGGICGWIVSFYLLQRRMENLDSFLMC